MRGYSPQIRFYLASAVAFGVSQAFNFLFLNFYLRSLGLGPEWQGLLNALPAVTLALLGLPAVAVARRISNARSLQLGALLGALGTALLAFAGGWELAVAGVIVQGVGGTLIMVASAPFMANNSSPEQRVVLFSVQMALLTGAGFIGNLLGGQIPASFAGLTGAEVDSLAALRAAMIASLMFQTVGLIPAAFLRPSGKRAPGSSFAVREKNKLARLVAPTVFVGLGAGATIPFLNVFIEGKFNVNFQQIGTLFAWTSLATAAAALVQPLLVRRFGQLSTIMLVQASSLPFLFVLGYANYLPLVILAMFTRGALMNAAGPVFAAYAMTELTEGDRNMFAALNSMAWNISWGLSAVAGGWVRGQLPFETAFFWLFAWTIAMYAANLLALYLLVVRPAKRRALAGVRV